LGVPFENGRQLVEIVATKHNAMVAFPFCDMFHLARFGYDRASLLFLVLLGFL